MHWFIRDYGRHDYIKAHYRCTYFIWFSFRCPMTLSWNRWKSALNLRAFSRQTLKPKMVLQAFRYRMLLKSSWTEYEGQYLGERAGVCCNIWRGSMAWFPHKRYLHFKDLIVDQVIWLVTIAGAYSCERGATSITRHSSNQNEIVKETHWTFRAQQGQNNLCLEKIVSPLHKRVA